MRKQIQQLWIVVGACLLFAACAEQNSWPIPEDEEAIEQGSFALLTLKADTGDSSSLGAEIEVTGQFVAYSGPSRAWAINTLDLWTPSEEQHNELDQCTLNLDPSAQQFTEASPELLSSLRIELQEAGEIEVRAPSQRSMETRQVPDLMDHFSGVVYRLPEGHGFHHEAGLFYSIHGEGSEHIGAFEVRVQAPPEMNLTFVGSVSYEDNMDVPLTQGQDLNVEWSLYNPKEHIYIDLYHDDLSSTPLLSCTAQDDGTFILPPELLNQLRSAYPEATFRAVARRAAIRDFDLEGVDHAQVIFTTSDVVFLTP